jgi:hypothetical protein
MAMLGLDINKIEGVVNSNQSPSNRLTFGRKPVKLIAIDEY